MGSSESTEKPKDGDDGGNKPVSKTAIVAKDSEDSGNKLVSKTAIVGGLVAGAVLVGFGIAALVAAIGSGSGFDDEDMVQENEEEDRKTMKAPGRDYRIYRDDFEKDPADYFRNLRK